MKRFLVFLPLVLVLALGVVFALQLPKDPNRMPSALVGKPFPEFELQALENSERLLNAKVATGDVHLVNVWGTWCPSCRAEHEYLMHLAEAGVKIIGVNYRDERNAALEWLQRLGNPYTEVIYDPQGGLGIDLGVTGSPETYIVGPNGDIHYRHIGVVNERVWQRVFLPVIEKITGAQP